MQRVSPSQNNNHGPHKSSVGIQVWLPGIMPQGLDVDMDPLITLLDHGYDDLEGFHSAEFVL